MIEIRLYPSESFFLYKRGERIKKKQKERVDYLLSLLQEKLNDGFLLVPSTEWKRRMLEDRTIVWTRKMDRLDEIALKRLDYHVRSKTLEMRVLDEKNAHHVFALKMEPLEGEQEYELKRKRKRVEEKEERKHKKDRVLVQVYYLGYFDTETKSFVRSLELSKVLESQYSNPLQSSNDVLLNVYYECLERD